ncbi:MAG: hypothetical protein AB7O28_10270 [Vicinamibacterales bacterium]
MTSSPDLAGIATLVSGNLEHGRPPFAGTPLDTSGLHAALDGCFGLGAVFPPGAACHLDDASCVVTGRLPVLGLPAVDVTGTFRMPDGNLQFTFEADLPASTFQLPGLERLQVDGAHLVVEVGGLGGWLPSVTWSIGTTVGAARSGPGGARGPSIAVTLTGPTGGPTWRLDAGPGAGSRLDLAAVAELLGAEACAASLPAGLKALAGLTLTSIEADVDPTARAVSMLAARLESSSAWPLVPGTTLTLDRVALTLSAADLGVGSTPSFAARLDARIGGVPVVVATMDVPTDVRLELAPGAGIALGALADLSRTLGVESLPALPAGLAPVTGLTLSDLQIDVGLDPPALHGAAARVALPGPWPIVGHVALRDAAVSLTIEQPGDPHLRHAAGDFAAWIDLGDTPVSLTGELDGDVMVFDASIGHVDLAELTALLLKDLPLTLPAGTALEEGQLSYTSDTGRLHVEATTAVDLFAIARACAIPLPDGFASLTLDGFALDHDSTGATTLAVSADAALEFPQGSAHRAKVSGLRVEIGRDGGGHVTTRASFDLDLDLAFSDDFALRVEATEPSGAGLHCEWDGGARQWSVNGQVTATLFGVKLPALTAGIGVDGDRCRFALRHDAPLTILDVPAVAQVTVSGLAVAVSRSDRGEGCDWHVEGASHVDVANVVTGTGRVALDKTASAWSVSVTATDVTVAPVTIGAVSGALSIRMLEVGAGGTPRTVFVEAQDVGLELTGLPPPIDQALPHGLTGSLRVDPTGVRLTLAPPSGFSIPFPALSVPLPDGTTRALGQPSVALMSVSATLGASAALTAEFAVGVPGALNAAFGAGPDGTPLFKDTITLAARLATSGVSLGFLDSPFSAIAFHHPDAHPDQTWFDWSLPCGDLSIRVPEFSLQAESFSAHGGVARRGDLRLPLGWLKALAGTPAFSGKATGRGVSAGGLARLAAELPDAIPITTFDLDRVLDTLRAVLARDPALAPLAKAIAEAESLESRLPALFRAYLDVELPTELVLDISVDASGGFAFTFSTGGPPGACVLLPGPMGLIGLTVRSISVGLALGGTLIRADVDADVDVFGFPDLAVALATGSGRQFGNRLLLHETQWVAPTEFPIPVPLFYGLLGWEYRGPFYAAETHWSFPAPTPTLVELVQILEQLFQFVTVDDKVLAPDFVPADCDPRLTLGVNQIALPAWLGGGRLRLNDAPISLSVSSALARLLDAAKFLNPAFLIRAVPLKDASGWIRIGHEIADVGPLHLEAAWCVTTEDEYRQTVLTDPAARAFMGSVVADGVLQTLSAASGGRSLDRGFVVLLMGEADLAGILGVSVEVGASLTAEGGFESAMRVTGTLGLLQVRIEGRVLAGPPQGAGSGSAVEIEGGATLSGGGHVWLASSGHVRLVPKERFEVAMTMTLSPVCHVQDGTWIIDRSGMEIRGTIRWTYGPALEASGTVTGAITKDGLTVTFLASLFSWTGAVTASLSTAAAVTGAIELDLPDALHDIWPGRVVNTAALIDRDIQTTLDQIGQKMQGLGGIPASLAGVRQMLPPLCNTVTAEIDKAIADGVAANWRTVYGAVITKQQLIDGAKQDLAKVYAVFRSLKAAASIPSDDDFRRQVDAQIRALIANRRVQVKAHLRDRYTGHDWADFVIWQGDLLARDDIGRLQASLLTLKYLPAQSQTTVPASAVFDQIVDRRALLAHIRSTAQTPSGPRLHSVVVTTALQALAARTDVAVTVDDGGTRYTFTVGLDLHAGLADAASALAEGFVRRRLGA